MQAEALLVPGACCRVPSLEALPSLARASLDRTVAAGRLLHVFTRRTVPR